MRSDTKNGTDTRTLLREAIAEMFLCDERVMTMKAEMKNGRKGDANRVKRTDVALKAVLVLAVLLALHLCLPPECVSGM